MKKIIITESQLKKITEILILEEELTDIMGIKAQVNKDGTVSFIRQDKKTIIIRFTTRYGNANITSITEQDGSYFITTRMVNTPQIIDNDGVKILVNFVNNPKKDGVKILWNIKIGDLVANWDNQK